MAESIGRSRIGAGHLTGLGQSGREIGGGLYCGATGHTDGQFPRGIDPSAEHTGEGAGAGFTGEEALHDAGRLCHRAAERIGAPGQEGEHDRCPGVEHGIEQLLLDTTELKQFDITSLAAGAAAEEPGPVPDG